MAKRKEKFPDLVFVKREHDKDGSSWLTSYEAVSGCVDSREWEDFAIYQRVGKGRGRTTDEVKVDAPKQVKAKMQTQR